MQAALGTAANSRPVLHNKPNRLHFYEDRDVQRSQAGKGGDVSEAELFYTQTDLLPKGKSTLNMQQISADKQSYMGEAFDKVSHATRRASALWNVMGNQNIITTRNTDIQFEHPAGLVLDSTGGIFNYSATAGTTYADTMSGIKACEDYDEDNPIITEDDLIELLELTEIPEDYRAANSDGNINKLAITGTGITCYIPAWTVSGAEMRNLVYPWINATEASVTEIGSTTYTGLDAILNNAAIGGWSANVTGSVVTADGYTGATTCNTADSTATTSRTCYYTANPSFSSKMQSGLAVGSTFTQTTTTTCYKFQTGYNASGYSSASHTAASVYSAITWTATYTVQEDGTPKLTHMTGGLPNAALNSAGNDIVCIVREGSTAQTSSSLYTLTSAQATLINDKIGESSGTEGKVWCLDLAAAKKYRLGHVMHGRTMLSVPSSRVAIDDANVGLASTSEAAMSDVTQYFNMSIDRSLWRVGHQLALTLMCFNPTFRTAALIDDTATQGDQAFSAYQMFRDLILTPTTLATKTLAVLRNTYNIDVATATVFKQLLDALVSEDVTIGLDLSDADADTINSENVLSYANLAETYEDVIDIINSQTYTGCTGAFLTQSRANAQILFLDMVRLYYLQVMNNFSDVEMRQLLVERATLLGITEVEDDE